MNYSDMRVELIDSTTRKVYLALVLNSNAFHLVPFSFYRAIKNGRPAIDIQVAHLETLRT